MISSWIHDTYSVHSTFHVWLLHCRCRVCVSQQLLPEQYKWLATANPDFACSQTPGLSDPNLDSVYCISAMCAVNVSYDRN